MALVAVAIFFAVLAARTVTRRQPVAIAHQKRAVTATGSRGGSTR
jgi:hypothetical protein